MKYIDITLFILSIFLIIYSIILNITFGFISFSKVILLLSFLVLIYCLIQFKIHHQLFNYLPKMIRTVLSILFISGFCLFITVEGIVIKGSLEKSKEEVKQEQTTKKDDKEQENKKIKEEKKDEK